MYESLFVCVLWYVMCARLFLPFSPDHSAPFIEKLENGYFKGLFTQSSGFSS